ncbi:hypothetical protein QTV49_004793 [Vibrio vulnificus]|nr:hypothetical protein [Vibrio vulnificus]
MNTVIKEIFDLQWHRETHLSQEAVSRPILLGGKHKRSMSLTPLGVSGFEFSIRKDGEVFADATLLILVQGDEIGLIPRFSAAAIPNRGLTISADTKMRSHTTSAIEMIEILTFSRQVITEILKHIDANPQALIDFNNERASLIRQLTKEQLKKDSENA